MSQCVPDWDLDDVLPHQHPASAATRATNVPNPPSEYGLSELTWRRGQLASHGLDGTAPEQRAGRPVHKRRLPGDAGAPWEKPLENGTLEAVVDQATRALVPGAMDALVPSARLRNRKGEDGQPCLVVPETASGGGAAGACVVSGGGRKRARHGAGEGDRSATGSAASAGLTLDWCADGAGFTTSGSPPSASPETDNTSGGRALLAVSEEDDSCYSRRSQDGFEDEKSRNEKIRRPVSSKRIRAAAVHNQSERKRRDKINQRMRTLQKLVPNSSKTDKASILDEVIDYMKQLQAQVQVMNRMSSMAPPMMMPMAMQQMGMAMMAQMAQMGAAMGMGMADAWQAPWAAFLPSSAPRDLPAGRDTIQAAATGAFLPDPFAAFLAFQAQQQPISATDPHSRMAAMHQQQYQQPPGPSREGAGRS